MSGKRKRGAKEGANAQKENSKKKAKKDGALPAVQPAFDKTPFAETLTMDERRREGRLYDLLGSEDENDRLLAADCIISCLLEGDGVSEIVLRRHLDKRLFRGLASGRNASRVGFSLVITELLSQLFGEKDLASKKYSGFSFEGSLELLTESTEPEGNVPGQEERNNFLGKLFGLECFVRSQTLFMEDSRWPLVLGMLLKLGSKKAWLRSQCGWVIVQALQQASQEKIAKMTLEKVAANSLAKSPEGVAMWLVTLNRFPDVKVKPWGHPLHAKSLGDLAAILKESFQHKGQGQEHEDRVNASNKGKQANWTAQLHFVWDMILAHYASDAVSADDFATFWSRVVDDGLFSKNATDGQKFKGFQVFQMMLAGLADQPSKIERLFSKNFMACLLNQAATEDRYLHRAAVKALKALEATVAQKPHILAPVLRNILGNNGAYSFDQRTNTKTADKLFQNINKENEKDIIKIIQTPLGTLAQRESADGQNTLRTYADYLSKVLNASARTDGEKKGANTSAAFAFALQELGQLAYSQPQQIPAALLTEQIRGLCRSRLETSFAKLLRSSDDFGVFCRAIAAIDATAIAADDQIKDAMKQALAQMNKLQKSKGKSEVEKSLTQGLALLHAVSIFQLYNEDPDAMEVLQDLAQFSERMGSSKTKGDQEAGSSELLVEILLSMVARPSSLMRQVSQQVFEAFTSQISAEGLELLIAPLASGESAKGQQELFHTEEEDEMNIDENEDESASDVEDVDEASDLELDSDVEFVGMAEDGDEEDDDSDSDSDDDDDESDGNEDKKKSAGKQEPVDLNELIGDILKSHALDKDKDAASSEDDLDMSDSEMLALDAKLVDVLRPHVKPSVDSKKKKKDAKQSVVNFKYRVLDLLDIYVKNEALNPLGLDLLAPLLRLMRTTSAKPLAHQACEIILNYQKALKKARSNKEAVKGSPASEDLLPALAEIHDEAIKDQSHAYAKAASAASLVVASLMFAVDRTSITQVVVVYAKTQSEWVLGNAKLQASFFTEWNNWCQNQASQAA